MIEVTIKDTSNNKEIKLCYKNCSIEQRIGLNKDECLGIPKPIIEPTGSQTCMIKLWSGCPSFEQHNPGNAGK